MRGLKNKKHEEANLEGLDSESCEGEIKFKLESLHVVVRLEGNGGIMITELLNFTKLGEAKYPWMLKDDDLILRHIIPGRNVKKAYNYGKSHKNWVRVRREGLTASN